jgi:hypothetical protein
MHPALENLCGPGKQLKAEAPDGNEIAGLLRTGVARLHDAQNTALALESRFDLAYNAAHAMCLAALRRMGYRASNRYIVFQVLPHTLGLGPRCGACWTNATTRATWASTKACWMWTSAW